MSHGRGRHPAAADADARPARRAGGVARAPGSWGAPLAAPSAPATRRHTRGFSLVELVIVVIILAIVASIAMRRVSRHAEAGAANAALQDVAVLQQAIERYRAEHGVYPAPAKIVEQLTGYTDVFGNPSPTRAAPYIYGPYVRRVPPVPLGPARGSATVDTAPRNDVGWIYDEASGSIRPNE